MKNNQRLRDHMDSLDMAVLAVKIEAKYKVDVFANSIPETYGELRKRLVITREHPLFAELWHKYENKEPITCLTSGTTGEPKQVTHPFEFWQRHIRPGSSEDVWGLCYDPTHIAGVFVILQAFANNSKLVLLWGSDNPTEEILENRITHLSASSTFYRLLEGVFYSVKSLTIGSMRPIDNLKFKFPKAEIRNIYATTEHGVIGVSNSDWYELKNNMTVTDAGELVVDGIPTGDMVVLNEDKFMIQCRIGQFAKVGGEKVYFEYVETVLMENNPAIQQIRVYAKDNPITGELLFADIVCEYKNISTQGLEKYQVPMINYVNQIDMTYNGKVKR